MGRSVTVLMLIVLGLMMILNKAAATSALGDECQEKHGDISIPHTIRHSTRLLQTWFPTYMQ